MDEIRPGCWDHRRASAYVRLSFEIPSIPRCLARLGFQDAVDEGRTFAHGRNGAAHALGHGVQEVTV